MGNGGGAPSTPYVACGGSTPTQKGNGTVGVVLPVHLCKVKGGGGATPYHPAFCARIEGVEGAGDRWLSLPTAHLHLVLLLKKLKARASLHIWHNNVNIDIRNTFLLV